MNPIVAGRLEGLLLASLLVQETNTLDPSTSAELANGIQAVAIQIACADLRERFTIHPGIVATLELNP